MSLVLIEESAKEVRRLAIAGSPLAIGELGMFATTGSTRTTARTLKPLVEALTTTGSGRFEQVKSAVERGLFNDLRLIAPAIRALDDIYPELADLVAEKILPGYGAGIV